MNRKLYNSTIENARKKKRLYMNPLKKYRFVFSYAAIDTRVYYVLELTR